VIDGSNIPSRIDFPSPAPKITAKPPAASTPEVKAPERVNPAPTPRPESAPSSSSTPALREPTIDDVLDDLRQQVSSGQQDRGVAPKNFVTANLEGFLTTAFDEWTDAPGDGLFAALVNGYKTLIEDQVKEFVQDYMRDVLSPRVLGDAWDSLPIEFRKDQEFISDTFARVYEPFSLNRGFEYVNKLGELFDLWGER
jgi:hypothetical protein